MKLKLWKLKNLKDEIKEKEDDIYTDRGLSQKSEDDGISEHEEAFMRGWLSC